MGQESERRSEAVLEDAWILAVGYASPYLASTSGFRDRREVLPGGLEDLAKRGEGYLGGKGPESCVLLH